MIADLPEQKNNHITLDDNSQYSYNVKPVEITNALGAVIAILEEYSIANRNGENYKLFKTTEGNWYDILEEISTENNSILSALKLAIDNR